MGYRVISKKFEMGKKSAFITLSSTQRKPTINVCCIIFLIIIFSLSNGKSKGTGFTLLVQSIAKDNEETSPFSSLTLHTLLFKKMIPKCEKETFMDTIFSFPFH